MKKSVLVLVATLFLLTVVPGAFWLLESYGRAQADATRSTMQTFLSPFVRLAAWGTEKFKVSLEYVVETGLVRRNLVTMERTMAELKAQNDAMRAEIAKFERLGGTAFMLDMEQWDYIPADVLAYGDKSWNRSLQVNRGTAHGVRVGDPVLHMEGLAGVVTSVGRWTSTIQLLIHPEMSVGCTVWPPHIQRVVEGPKDGSAFLEIIIDDPQAQTRTRKGQEVVTSGMTNSLYPSGLSIGIVEKIDKDRYGQVVAYVRPRVNFENLEEVVILSIKREETRKSDLDFQVDSAPSLAAGQVPAVLVPGDGGVR